MLDIFVNETVLLMFVTAVAFTFLGRYTAYRAAVEDAVSAVVDSLIEDGYIKTKGKGEDMEILKHWEHNNDT